MTSWPFDRRYSLWVVSSLLLSLCPFILAAFPPILLPLVSATSFVMTFVFARFPSEPSQDLSLKSDLLRFCTDLSVDMSSGISAESALSKRVQEGDEFLAPVSDSISLLLLSGTGAEHILPSLRGKGSKGSMKTVFSKMVGYGTADILSAGPFLDMWAENLALAVESKRSLEEISHRAEFLHYLISFTMGFLSASTSLVSKLRVPYTTQLDGPTAPLMFVSLFFLKSSIFTISSRKFQFRRPLIKFATGSALMIVSFLSFSRLLSIL